MVRPMLRSPRAVRQYHPYPVLSSIKIKDVSALSVVCSVRPSSKLGSQGNESGDLALSKLPVKINSLISRLQITFV